jgi:hypothetical protein
MNNDDERQRRHDYDQRQYRVMLERLDDFLAERRHLMQTIGDLETLLNVLEGEVNERWACEVSDLCNKLEVINAGHHGSIGPSLSREDLRKSREIAEELKRLVIPKIEPLSADE